ncbi:hypothetical protein H4R27_000350 [Coemansia aciculifera]|nr:hypothetical protein H4R27_000350 [Coemansia aciculifera]
MSQDATLSSKTAAFYTDNVFQKAKDVLEKCTLVNEDTKECHSSRIALWIHYCNQFSGGDDKVTDSRLADYVEWMVNSGYAERIRQEKSDAEEESHIQQVLRNQLQSVMCYWRIQNNDPTDIPGSTDIPDPRRSTVFLTKWKDIVQRYPYKRLPRRIETIYSALPARDEPTDA